MNHLFFTGNMKSCSFLIVGIFVFFSSCHITLAQAIESQEVSIEQSIENPYTVHIAEPDLKEIKFVQEVPVTNYELTLESTLNLALENNSLFNIQKKESKIYSLRATKSTLDYLPDMNIAMRYGYSTQIASIGTDTTFVIPGVGPLTFAGFKVEDRWKRRNTVRASQPLTVLYEIYHRNKIVHLSFDKALLEEEYAANTLALNIYQTFFHILTLKYQIEAGENNITELESIHQLAQSRYEEGFSLLRDVQKVELELDYAKHTLMMKQNDLQESLNYLKKLSGLSLKDTLTIDAAFTPFKVPVALEELQTIAVENNQRLKVEELNIKIARHSKKEAYGAYIPDIYFDTTYVNQSGDEFLPKNNLVMSFNMDFNFFDWGKRELTIKERQLQIEQRQLAYKNYIDEIQLEVEKKFNKVEEARNLIDTTLKAVELAKNNFDITANRYKVGMALMTDVLSDQSDLAQARAEYYRALFGEQSAMAELKQSMGLLITQED
jgi:outer membrane protein TolC